MVHVRDVGRKRLPVVGSDGRLIGIVSRRDVLAAGSLGRT